MPVGFDGLPFHPLIVHAAVVFVPLTLLGTIVIAVRANWRRALGWWVLLLAIVTMGFTVLAKESGEALGRVIGDPDPHAEIGDTVPIFAAAMVVTVALLVFASSFSRWRQRRKATKAAAAATAQAASSPAASVVPGFDAPSPSVTVTAGAPLSRGVPAEGVAGGAKGDAVPASDNVRDALAALYAEGMIADEPTAAIPAADPGDQRGGEVPPTAPPAPAKAADTARPSAPVATTIEYRTPLTVVLLAILAVLAGLAGTVQTVRAGDSGARAVWEGSLNNPAPSASAVSPTPTTGAPVTGAPTPASSGLAPATSAAAVSP